MTMGQMKQMRWLGLAALFAVGLAAMVVMDQSRSRDAGSVAPAVERTDVSAPAAPASTPVEAGAPEAETPADSAPPRPNQTLVM